jgi:hypothetical protein
MQGEICTEGKMQNFNQAKVVFENAMHDARKEGRLFCQANTFNFGYNDSKIRPKDSQLFDFLRNATPRTSTKYPRAKEFPNFLSLGTSYCPPARGWLRML